MRDRRARRRLLTGGGTAGRAHCSDHGSRGRGDGSNGGHGATVGVDGGAVVGVRRKGVG